MRSDWLAQLGLILTLFLSSNERQQFFYYNRADSVGHATKFEPSLQNYTDYKVKSITIIMLMGITTTL
jgi:hypothetical protein